MRTRTRPLGAACRRRGHLRLRRVLRQEDLDVAPFELVVAEACVCSVFAQREEERTRRVSGVRGSIGRQAGAQGVSGARAPASAMRANSMFAVPSSCRPIATMRPLMRGRMSPSRSPREVPFGRPMTCATTEPNSVMLLCVLKEMR